jgi:hypothetical protein
LPNGRTEAHPLSVQTKATIETTTARIDLSNVRT